MCILVRIQKNQCVLPEGLIMTKSLALNWKTVGVEYVNSFTATIT